MTGGGEPKRPSFTVTIEGGPSFQMAADEDSLLRGALRAGIGFPHECSVGGCGACRFELLDGAVDTLWAEAPGVSERDRKRGKRLACQSKPAADCRVKLRSDATYQPVVAPRKMLAWLLERRDLSPDMSRFTFEVADAPVPRPGQYALLYPPGVRGARAYSLSNLPRPGQPWQFIVRRVPDGRGSSALFESVVQGVPVPIDGPYGHAWLRPGMRDVVCIAGGSGLGPMLSVARGVSAEPGHRRVRLFVGLRSMNDLGAMDDALDLASNPRVDTTVVLSDQPSPSAWQGPLGFVHGEVERRLGALEGFDFYFAGPPRMVDAVLDMLVVRHRVPAEQLHFDRFV